MKWPNGNRCAVCFTFDVDGPLIWRNKSRQDPKFGNPVCVSQGMFGPRVGVPRILNLLKTYDLKGCFFIPGKIVEEFPDLARRIRDEGHEIGFHGYDHTNPADLNYQQEKQDFEKGFEVFHKMLGIRPRGYRSAGAQMSDHTWELLADFGFTYDSTMMDSDAPYRKEVGNHKIVILPIHWILDDWTHFGWNLNPALASQANIQSQETVFQIWKGEFDGMYDLDEGCIFTLLMHPQLSGRASRIKLFERLIQHIRKFPAVRVAKAIELAKEALSVLDSHR